MTGAQRIQKMIKSTHKRLHWLAYVSAFGGAAIIVSVWLILSLSGITESFSPKLRAATTLTVILFAGALIWRGFKRFKKPSINDARRHVDALSETHPATTFSDNPIHPHAKAAALWAEHRARVSKQAETLSAPSLLHKARAIDPLFLRILLPICLLASALFAGELFETRFKSAFSADYGSLVGADKLKAQAWVTPPAYTGQAPFDVAMNENFRAPQGSDFTIRVETHGKPKLRLIYGDKQETIPLLRGDDGTFETQLKLDLKNAVRAEIHWWGKRATYTIATNNDAPPKIEFDAYPKVDDNDRAAFGWKAEDDYGLAKIEFVLRPATEKSITSENSDAIALEIPGIEPRKANNTTAINFTRHKWAGIEVIAYLKATDAAGQSSASREVAFTLPEKLFLQPMARAAMEVRNVVLRETEDYSPATEKSPETQLMDDGRLIQVAPSKLEAAPQDIRRAAVMLDALTFKPETYFNDRVLYLGLRQAKEILATANNKPQADESESILWAVAMRAEYGTMADAARALEAARKALETALRDGAPEDEIKRLMQAYRQAVENYIEMRTAEALRRGINPSDLDDSMSGGDSNTVGDSDLERMLKALEELTETGASDQARQLLSDMNDLLENLKDIEFKQGKGGDGPQEEGPMSRALEKLAEELRDQRDLNDDTNRARKEQEQGSSQSDGQQGSNSTPSQGQQQGSTSPEDLARRQRELLNRRQSGLGSDNGEQPQGSEGTDENGYSESENGDYEMDAEGYRTTQQGDAFAEAESAQKKAVEALENGDLDEAARYQKQAEQALTRAATEMAETADKMRGEASGTGGDANQSDDPLGRPTGRGLVGNGDDIKVPDEADRQRAHQILEELRERSAKSGLTDEEMDYLLRLLKRF